MPTSLIDCIVHFFMFGGKILTMVHLDALRYSDAVPYQDVLPYHDTVPHHNTLLYHHIVQHLVLCHTIVLG